MSQTIYSTDRRGKTDFATKTPGKVDFYVCGPTVYDSCHIGHARPAVVFDTVRRWLEYSGRTVNFISNITDIDDKIIRRAGELGISCPQLANRYQDEYERDMTRLGVRAPTVRPRATEHIAEMLEIVQGLAEKGVAYQTPRGMWFDVTKFADYGKLSGRTADDEATEHRVEQDSDKRHPQDFALWKSAKPGEPSWPSPWGPGRPGWHIECSAMAGKYADYQLDIHGGGADLAFPHHENEVAQSEAFSGKPFARYWMHNGFITVGSSAGADDEKMGKSKGNAFWLRDAFAIAPPAALRLWVLGTHYRMPLAYRAELLPQNAAALARLGNACEALTRALAGKPVPPAAAGPAVDRIRDLEGRFRAAMEDDFNTPQALAAVYELATVANAAVAAAAKPEELSALWASLSGLLGVLGLPLAAEASGAAGDADAFMKLILAIRKEARAAKNFALSDQIRDGLTAMGIEVNDRAGETTWKRSAAK